MGDIVLADYIEGLRAELQSAVQSGQNQDVRFALDKIDLELEVIVEAGISAKAEGKFKFWVINGGAEADAKMNRKTNSEN